MFNRDYKDISRNLKIWMQSTIFIRGNMFLIKNIYKMIMFPSWVESNLEKAFEALAKMSNVLKFPKVATSYCTEKISTLPCIIGKKNIRLNYKTSNVDQNYSSSSGLQIDQKKFSVRKAWSKQKNIYEDLYISLHGILILLCQQSAYHKFA